MRRNGRVEGGASLLIHQTPADADPDAALTVVVAENQLGPVYEEPHGRELLANSRAARRLGQMDRGRRFEQHLHQGEGAARKQRSSLVPGER